MVNTTTHRHDFTEEERLAYNKYMVAKMQEYRKTDHGREMVNRNNRLAYYRRKERLAKEKAEKIQIEVFDQPLIIAECL